MLLPLAVVMTLSASPATASSDDHHDHDRHDHGYRHSHHDHWHGRRWFHRWFHDWRADDPATAMTTDQVRKVLETALRRGRFDRLRVGGIDPTDDGRISAVIETVDGSLVKTLDIDPTMPPRAVLRSIFD